MAARQEQLRALWLLLRRSGWRRSYYRLRRLIMLKVIDPRFADRLFPKRPISSSPPSLQPSRLTRLQQLVHLRSQAFEHEVDLAGPLVTLLNSNPLPLRLPVSWHALRQGDPLWGFRLHGWDWAWSIIAESGTAQNDHFWALVADWLQRVPFGKGIPYQPHPTSRRLVVWMAAWHQLGGTAELLAEIGRQADYLAAHLEHDLENNHLIANAKALAWVGLLWPDPNSAAAIRWRDTGLQTLWAALRMQVMSDGGHFENSTSYQVEVWVDGLEIALLSDQLPADILDRLRQMTRFAVGLQRPDGRLPLLNDAIEDEHLPLSIAFAIAQLLFPDLTVQELPPELLEYPQTGLTLYRAAETNSYLLFDTGELGPLHCPGHGHADTLSLEWWVYGRPVLIDPGTYQYPAGEWRNYFRSTAAHSTVVVDGQDQSTFTGPFRVADMASGQLLLAQKTAQGAVFEGQHDGYQRLSDPVIHRRRVEVAAQSLTVTDHIEGHGAHDIAVYWHLSPLVERVEMAPQVVSLYFLGGIVVEVTLEADPSFRWHQKDGWCSRKWYQKEPSIVLVASATLNIPTVIRTIWQVRRNEAE